MYKRQVLTNDTYAVLRSGFADDPASLPVDGIAVTCGTGINCLGAVSYTHLEVYKRQDPRVVEAVREQLEQLQGLDLSAARHLPCLLYTSRCV